MPVSKALLDQIEFTRHVPRLIDKAVELGYNVTLGDCYRDPRLHGNYGIKQGYGASRSFHKLKKAIDLNLFDCDGKYCAATEDHQKLGEFWESLGGSWGGRFEDGNHYSWGEGQ